MRYQKVIGVVQDALYAGDLHIPLWIPLAEWRMLVYHLFLIITHMQAIII